jgi:hypothetical protein
VPNTLIVIKLRDDVIVPTGPNDRLILGDRADFAQAQTAFQTYYQASFPPTELAPRPDVTGFATFFSTYQSLIPDRPLNALYYLAPNKVSFVQQVAPAGNFLTYFAFVYPIDTDLDTTFRQVLDNLIALPTVEFWWAEGPMTRCSPGGGPLAPAAPASVNAYYDSLRFQTFGTNRGQGAVVVDAEDFGDVPVHPYLPQLTRPVLLDKSTNTAQRPHFYQTLGVLFAIPPPQQQSAKKLATDKTVIGIVPSAQLATLPFDNTAVPTDSTSESPDVFRVNFFVRQRMPALLTNKDLTRQLPVLLFERQVLFDMRQAMVTCQKLGVLVVQPAGQQVSDTEFSLDDALRNLSRLPTGAPRLPKIRYTDFTTGSVCLTVGALTTGGGIKPTTNTGTIVDVFLWGENIRTLAPLPLPQPGSKPNPEAAFADYGFTSGASAIAAGIVAALQAAALRNGKPLTTNDIKAVFKQTFRAGGSKLFADTTLAQLWTVCADRLRLPANAPLP